MSTLNLDEAADLLKMHKQSILKRARSGEIPAAKPGKCWVFIEEDLFNWLRSHYNQQRQDVSKEVLTCSLKEKNIGITNSRSREKLYIDLLAPATKKKHKS